MTLYGSAKFSSCGNHRFELIRTWDATSPPGKSFRILRECQELHDTHLHSGKRFVLFIGLNPSTASATSNDPTIRKLIRFAIAWGYDGLLVGNLFSLRTPEPNDLLSHSAPVMNPQNDEALLAMAKFAEAIVLAWGSHPIACNRAKEVMEKLSGPFLCIKKNAPHRGISQPTHPLYLPANLPLQPFP